MTMTTTASGVKIRHYNRAESRAAFEELAQATLRISADEFVNRWKNGAYRDSDEPEVVRLSVFLPVRKPRRVKARAGRIKARSRARSRR